MIDQQSAQNSAFKIRVFMFTWAVLTVVIWYFFDNFLDETLTKSFHIFLQATLVSFSPLRLFEQEPLLNIEGQSFYAEKLLEVLSNYESVKKMNFLFFIVIPVLTAILTSLIFFFTRRRKKEVAAAQHQLKKWSND